MLIGTEYRVIDGQMSWGLKGRGALGSDNQDRGFEARALFDRLRVEVRKFRGASWGRGGVAGACQYRKRPEPDDFVH